VCVHVCGGVLTRRASLVCVRERECVGVGVWVGAWVRVCVGACVRVNAREGFKG